MHRDNFEPSAAPDAQPSQLSIGNAAVREKQYELAMECYLRALHSSPAIQQIILGNIELARNRNRRWRQTQEPRIGLCGSRRNTERMQGLSQLHRQLGVVKLLVYSFDAVASHPFKSSSVANATHWQFANDESFLRDAMKQVLANPMDVVHLVGSNSVNLIIGAMYKLFWASKVLLDIEDDHSPTDNTMFGNSIGYDGLPPLAYWENAAWHRYTRGLLYQFDAITVASPVLQERHGGELLSPVWDQAISHQLQRERFGVRSAFGIAANSQVLVLAEFGQQLAQVLELIAGFAAIGRRDLVLIILGNFKAEHAGLKTNLQQRDEGNVLFLEATDEVLTAMSMADAYLLLADSFQVKMPACIGDAFARQKPVFASHSLALHTCFTNQLVFAFNSNDIAASCAQIVQMLDAPENLRETVSRAEATYKQEFALSTQMQVLTQVLELPGMPSGKVGEVPVYCSILQQLAHAQQERAVPDLLSSLSAMQAAPGSTDPRAVEPGNFRTQQRIAGFLYQNILAKKMAQLVAKHLMSLDVETFIAQLFQMALGREVRQPELEHYCEELSHRSNRYDVVQIAFTSPESVNWLANHPHHLANHCDEMFAEKIQDDTSLGEVMPAFLERLEVRELDLASESGARASSLDQSDLVADVQPVADQQHSISLPYFAQPKISVIVPVYGKVEYTLMCLRAIQANLPALSFEVIVVDDKSPDDTLQQIKGIPGLRVVENKQNMGFIRSCNHGASRARGEYLCFLNNDTEVKPGWLDALMQTFDDFPGTGLVGSKFIYPDGRLQEAGGILWQDGSAWNFGRLQEPDLPHFNYAREVDYCSGASIMLRKELFDQLGGFDEHYLPAYCEDSDLALKVRAKGLRVIYQPMSVVVHYEGITSGTDLGQGAKAYQVENSKKLYARWRDRLAQYQPNGQLVDKAKDRGVRYRALVLDHCTPTPNQDAGSVTTLNMLLLLREMGYQVTFIPEDNFLYMPEYTTVLQRQGIEVLYAPYTTSVEQHLEAAGERYDLALLFRPGVVEKHLSKIRQFCPQAKVLFHTIDLHFLRMTREAKLLDDPKRMQAAMEMKQREYAAIRGVDATIVHSQDEMDLLKPDLPQESIYVYPLILHIRGTAVAFDQRQGMVFVGGYQHVPNIDAVEYFIGEVMPILRRQLPGVHFHVVGSKPPEKILKLAAEDVIIEGFIDDLPPYLDQRRISVAPLRYGAGIKGKIGTAMSVGLPTVATSLAAEGMNLSDGEDVLIADGAQKFADAITRLYQDPVLWQKIQQQAIICAQEQWGPNAAWRILRTMLEDLGMRIAPPKYALTLFH